MHIPVFTHWLLCIHSAKVYIDKKLKRNANRDPNDLIGDILQQSSLSKKELYAAITELQIGGVETVSHNMDSYTSCSHFSTLITFFYKKNSSSAEHFFLHF